MKTLTSSLKAYGLPDFLQELGAIVIALLNPEGEVLTANQGFLNIARLQAPPEDGWNAASFFLNPPLQALAKMLPDAEDSVIFRGILTLGREDTIGHSLQGSVYRWQHCLLIIAEHDTDGLEQLNDPRQSRGLIRVSPSKGQIMSH